MRDVYRTKVFHFTSSSLFTVQRPSKIFILSECYNVNSVTHSFNNYWSDLDHKAVKKSRSTMDKYKINFSLIPQFSWFNLILSCRIAFVSFYLPKIFFNSIPFFSMLCYLLSIWIFFFHQYNCNDNSMACSMAYNNNYLLWLTGWLQPYQ
jgi:hypothetical protein